MDDTPENPTRDMTVPIPGMTVDQAARYWRMVAERDAAVAAHSAFLEQVRALRRALGLAPG